jgi:hypothetical protein
MEKQILFIFCHLVPEDLWFFFASSHLIAPSFASPCVNVSHLWLYGGWHVTSQVRFSYTKQCHDMYSWCWSILYFSVSRKEMSSSSQRQRRTTRCEAQGPQSHISSDFNCTILEVKCFNL